MQNRHRGSTNEFPCYPEHEGTGIAWLNAGETGDREGDDDMIFNRHFYLFDPLRPLEAIDADLKECTDTIKRIIEEMAV